MKAAATTTRTFRSFLLMSQLEAQEIGARIKQKRLERGMTQEELAQTASFSARSLQDYENGVTIPYKHFQELGRLLDVSHEWFMYGDEDEGESFKPVVQQPDPLSGTWLGRLLALLQDPDPQPDEELERVLRGYAEASRRLADEADAQADLRAARRQGSSPQ